MADAILVPGRAKVDGGSASPVFATRELTVHGSLAPWVKGLVGVEIAGRGPIPLAIAPHDSWMLTVQTGRGADGAEHKRALGCNTALTGVRQWTGSFQGAGECVTLFALLTPLGLVELLDSRRLDTAPRIRATVHELLDEHFTTALESAVASASDLDGKLRAFARALESRGTAARRQSRAAVRAARAAMVMTTSTRYPVEAAASAVHTSRRQLERDFARWLGTSPRHWSQVARVQAVPRRAAAGERLADIAAHLGFADQSHMNNSVKQLTGLTPMQYLRAGVNPLGAAFRRVTRGGVVYL
ncbi:helix-turn-helix domain-containing protein [Piscinibacter sp. XHJ-5]|uniref:AraC family transcriptional regulator n=1 Tax=Piscinibacter sp. XHJ-5 TaxID=3037797 RepID=UPI00245371A6|nr:helix-turn-helix domain-containing protein [Piscinibacter sp. XHJ-5]